MTLLFYVDESHDRSHHYHAGLLATGAAVRAVEQQLQAIVENAGDIGACVRRAELHGVELYHQTGSWSGATPDQCIAAYTSALQLLNQYGVEIIARGTDLARFASKYGSRDPYDWRL